MKGSRNLAESHLLITKFCLGWDITNSTQILKRGKKHGIPARRKELT
jgi:hypothetical protein